MLISRQILLFWIVANSPFKQRNHTMPLAKETLRPAFKDLPNRTVVYRIFINSIPNFYLFVCAFILYEMLLHRMMNMYHKQWKSHKRFRILNKEQSSDYTIVCQYWRIRRIHANTFIVIKFYTILFVCLVYNIISGGLWQNSSINAYTRSCCGPY